MNPLFELLLIAFVALVSVVLLLRLEQRLHRPGLFFLVAGITIAIAAAWGFTRGDRLLPSLFCLQVPGFFYLAWWRRSNARVRERT